MKSPNVKEIISIFENSAKHTDSKPEMNTTTNHNQPKTERKKSNLKANSSLSPAATTNTTHIENKKQRNRKLVLPAEFKFKKLSDHFGIREKVKTSTGDPPDAT